MIFFDIGIDFNVDRNACFLKNGERLGMFGSTPNKNKQKFFQAFWQCFALFALAAVALPPVMGIVTEKAVRAELETELADNPYVEAELVEYQRGYRTSTGRANLMLARGYRESMVADAESPEARQRLPETPVACCPEGSEHSR